MVTDYDKFELTEDDNAAIELAKTTIRLLLKHPQITPQQIIGLGEALLALNRMPLATPEAFSQFSLVYRTGTDDYYEMQYIQFSISESEFEISLGGSNYDKSVGSDSFSFPGWLIQTGGYSEGECDLYTLEDRINYYFNNGAVIYVNDESLDSEDDVVILDDDNSVCDDIFSDLLMAIVSRQDVENRDIQPVLSTLRRLLESGHTARQYMERVDIGFDGYDNDRRELFEIPEVRQFVSELNSQFPFWLFFLSKHMLGLQCIMFCLLPPFLTPEARVKIHPTKLGELLTTSWFPAMNHLAEYAGLNDDEINQLTERALIYFTQGRTTD